LNEAVTDRPDQAQRETTGRRGAPPFGFQQRVTLPGRLGRSGVITTPHGEIRTPAFSAVGTQATV
jgi:queuine tRNA-ribosyltransferase